MFVTDPHLPTLTLYSKLLTAKLTTSITLLRSWHEVLLHHCHNALLHPFIWSSIFPQLHQTIHQSSYSSTNLHTHPPSYLPIHSCMPHSAPVPKHLSAFLSTHMTHDKRSLVASWVSPLFASCRAKQTFKQIFTWQFSSRLINQTINWTVKRLHAINH